MNINVVLLLKENPILLIFVVLASGLALGKIRFGSLQVGNSIGVLVTSLLMGHLGFSLNSEALTIGFMLFIYCVGIEAGPNFSVSFPRRKTLPDLKLNRPHHCQPNHLFWR